jgi:hypothetical protein
VAPLVFKTSERRAASLAGSIPVRLRHLHVRADQVIRRIVMGYPRPTVPRADGNVLGKLARHDAPSTRFATASAAALCASASMCV